MTNMRTCPMTALLSGALLLSACSPVVTASIPRTTSSITGQVTAIALPMVVVEENPGEPHGSAKARVRTKATQVLREGDGVVDVTTLGVGQQVKVWFTGPVMESYPLQATAGVIVIEPSR